MADDQYRFEMLGPQHNRVAFRCANHEITHYFRRYALANSESRIAAAWVLQDTRENRVAGFYTLSAASVSAVSLPPVYAERLPRYPVPVALLGRMGVDKRYERRGLGSRLVVDALLRVYRQSTLAVYAMVVDPKDDVRDFYTRKFGFVSLANDDSQLILPLETFAAGFTMSEAPAPPNIP